MARRSRDRDEPASATHARPVQPAQGVTARGADRVTRRIRRDALAELIDDRRKRDADVQRQERRQVVREDLAPDHPRRKKHERRQAIHDRDQDKRKRLGLCKDRPDRRKPRRAGDGAKRPFIPWCRK